MVADQLADDESLSPACAGITVSSQLADWVLTLSVVGEADIATAAPLREQLNDACAVWPYAVVIDLTRLTFCGLAGLDALNDALAREGAEHTPVVTGMSAQLTWLRHTFPRA